MNDRTPDLARLAVALFGEYLRKIEHCVALLSPEQLWWRPNPACTSVGNLLLHLCGNLSQWVLDGLGAEPYRRDRRAEFAAATGEDGHVLGARLREVVEQCRKVAAGLSAEDMRRSHTIQGITRDGFGVLLHAVEHMAYHTGQIVFVAKQLLGEEAGIEFYPHLR